MNLTCQQPSCPKRSDNETHENSAPDIKFPRHIFFELHSHCTDRSCSSSRTLVEVMLHTIILVLSKSLRTQTSSIPRLFTSWENFELNTKTSALDYLRFVTKQTMNSKFARVLSFRRRICVVSKMACLASEMKQGVFVGRLLCKIQLTKDQIPWIQTCRNPQFTQSKRQSITWRMYGTRRVSYFSGNRPIWKRTREAYGRVRWPLLIASKCTARP